MKAWKPEGIRDVGAGILATLLALNFAVESVLFFTMVGVIFLKPGPAFATSSLLLLGIIWYLAFRKGLTKIWRRLLLGGILCNLALAAVFLLGVIAMTIVWL